MKAKDRWSVDTADAKNAEDPIGIGSTAREVIPNQGLISLEEEPTSRPPPPRKGPTAALCPLRATRAVTERSDCRKS